MANRKRVRYLRAIDEKMHVHDLHATILHLIGLDHMGLVYTFKGRPERPTLNEGAPNHRLTGRTVRPAATGHAL